MENKPGTRAEYQKHINIIIEYINNHLDGMIDTGSLAEMSGFSPWHFHRIIKAFLGEPIGAFIVRKRLETAAHLIRYTDLPIQDIAFRVGYDTPSSLSKLFRQFYGISPNKYRNNKHYVIMKPVQLNPDLRLNAPQIKTLPEQTAIYIRLNGAYMNNDYCGAWQKLWNYVRECQLFSPGMEHICIYHDDPKVTETDKLHTDVCLTLDETAKPQGEIGVKTIAAGRYAIFSYQGPYSNLSTVYDTIYSKWLPESEQKLGMTPGFEKYLNNPADTAPENLLTEIYIPLE